MAKSLVNYDMLPSELSNEILSKEAIIVSYVQENGEFKLSEIVKLGGILFAEKRERKLREVES
jgi:hypothetical protein